MKLPHSNQRKTKAMIAGEFNAGKSKLINGLVGQDLLPSQAVSTLLPPTWITYGNAPAFRVDQNGNWYAIEDFDSCETKDTKYCRMFSEAPMLENLDLIEAPCDPDPAIWGQMVGEADIIVWCSHAMQAWRRSEKSFWQRVPVEVAERSILLLTHADHLNSDHDRLQVLRRVRDEAREMFRDIQMLSLTSTFQVAEFAAELRACAGAVPTAPADTAIFQAPAPIRLVGPTTEQAVINIFAPEKPFSQRQSVGEARAVWNRITHNRDLAQPEVVKASVEALLSELDEAPNFADFPLARANEK